MRICLNMIVKNEAAVIRRCLATVKPWVDYWVIVDTGSTDGTQDIVREFMQGVPGELHERPWQNFAHNRNEALALAKAHGDYLLFIDADETLQMPDEFQWTEFAGDGYRFRCEYDGWDYQRNALVATRLPWQWVGVLHEFLHSNRPHVWNLLPGPAIVVQHDGARGRDPETYMRDIEVLERAVAVEPDNTRYVFYLAQSYRDAGRLEQSIARYRQRTQMGGWEEERWFALFQVAVLSEKLGAPPAEVNNAYLTAYQTRPLRAEPLCALAQYHRLKNEFALAHLYARQAAAIAYPTDGLFVDTSVYTWRALDELVVSAYYANAHEEGRAALLKLLTDNRFPDTEHTRILGNRTFYGLTTVETPSSPSPTGSATQTTDKEEPQTATITSIDAAPRSKVLGKALKC